MSLEHPPVSSPTPSASRYFAHDGETLTSEGYARAAAAGDQDAFTRLHQMLNPDLEARLRSRIQHDQVAVAQDVSQEAWLTVSQKMSGYVSRKEGGFEGYLWTVARNTLYAHYKKVTRRRETLTGEMIDHDVVNGELSTEERVERRAQYERLAAEIMELPAAQSRCVVLRFHVGYSLDQTAAAMGKTPNAVKQLQLRGIKALRERLGSEFNLATKLPASFIVAAAAKTRTQPEPEETR